MTAFGSTGLTVTPLSVANLGLDLNGFVDVFGFKSAICGFLTVGVSTTFTSGLTFIGASALTFGVISTFGASAFLTNDLAASVPASATSSAPLANIFLPAFHANFAPLIAPLATAPPATPIATSVPTLAANSLPVISPLSYCFLAFHVSYAVHAAPPAHSATGISGSNSVRYCSPSSLSSTTIPSSKCSTTRDSINISPNSNPTISPVSGCCDSSNKLCNLIWFTPV